MEPVGHRRGPGHQAGSSGAAQRYLEVASGRLRAVRRTLEAYGEASLRDYVHQALRVSAEACQERSDLLAAVGGYVRGLLGEEVARRVVSELADAPLVLTANHHGVDFFAQSVQSSLAFALRDCGRGRPARTVPVFACGAIPLNNVTYPRGLLIYHGDSNRVSRLPVKLPIFPDRLKHALVSAVSAFDEDMLARAEQRVERLFRDGAASLELRPALHAILQGEYADAAVLSRRSYSEQAVLLNHRIWKRMYREPDSAPDLVFIELERIAADLLREDVFVSSSLAHRVLFDDRIRSEIIRALDGRRACWTRPAAGGGAGTVFFWGLDALGRRFGLDVVAGRGGRCDLGGVDAAGARAEVPLTPHGVADALARRALLPSLFTSYLVVALARGVTCVGGYYQAEYLPAMQRVVADALGRCPETAALAERVRRVPSAAYLSGMQAIMGDAGGGTLSPAGVVEVIARGGLRPRDLERIGALSVRDAHLASVVDTVRDAVPAAIDSARWQEQIGTDLHRILGRRVLLQQWARLPIKQSATSPLTRRTS